jgi:hypothetical protein
MKVLTFSRHYPKGHPKVGTETNFPEKIMACLADNIPNWTMKDDFVLYDWYAYYNCTMLKHHTIRSGSRFKPGDMASLRVWSGVPYRSKQIEFAQVEVKKVWKIEISEFWFLNGCIMEHDQVIELAKNDGLAYDDFVSWFNIHPKKKDVFRGQVISWNSSIEYIKES